MVAIHIVTSFGQYFQLQIGHILLTKWKYTGTQFGHHFKQYMKIKLFQVPGIAMSWLFFYQNMSDSRLVAECFDPRSKSILFGILVCTACIYCHNSL